MFGFFATALSIWGAMHWYAYARLLRDPDVSAEGTLIAVLVMAMGALAAPVAFSRRLAPPWSGRVHRAAFTWMGTIFIADVLLLVGDAMLLGVHASMIWATDDGVLVARIRTVATIAIAVTLIVRALTNAAAPAPIRRVDIYPVGWPVALDGLTVAVISDLHVTPGTSPTYVRDIVERTNATTPDIVALCGDLVDGPVSALSEAVRPLGNLRARLGTFAVTGNHEFFSGAAAWVAFLRTLGVDVLENERRTIDVGESTFDVAGVPDFIAGRFGSENAPNLADTLSGRDPTRPVILFAHQPRQFDEAAALGVTLQLSGHTHGGQIWPFTMLVRLVDHRVAGIYRQGHSLLYVSRGIRYWGPPMRLGAPHELSFLTLRAA